MTPIAATSARLSIAIQKSGRLADLSLELLRACGIKFSLHKARLLAHAQGHPIDLLRVRDDDIPGLVMDGVVDVGIVGEDVLEEAKLERQQMRQAAEVSMLRNLGFGHCRLALAMPTEQAKDFQLAGKRIATSYPQILGRWLEQHAINAQAVMLAGSVEVAPRAGLADAICDLVSTGATLEANGLVEGETIFRSQAQLISREDSLNAEKLAILQRFLRRLDGVQQAKESKYIMLHAPVARLTEVTALLPAEHPTVLALEHTKEHVAVHAVSNEKVFWETMEALRELGCSEILVLPIEKMLA